MKCANQSHNNSKGPSEDAKGNRYKRICIPSKTSWQYINRTWKQKRESKEEATTPKAPQKARRFATADGVKDQAFWRNILWCDETKTELFGDNGYCYAWRKRRHASRVVAKWLKVNRLKVLEGPSQSPDFNPIEHLWAEQRKHVWARRPANLTEVKST